MCQERGEKNHITQQQLGRTDKSAPVLINELGHYATASYKDFSLFLFLPNLNDGEFTICREKLETEACLFTMLWVNICLVKKKRKRNSSIDAFGAAANTDD